MNNRPENTPEPQHPPKSPLSKIRLSNAFYPILIGLGAVGYMLWKDFDIQVFSGITFSWHMVFWLVMAVRSEEHRLQAHGAVLLRCLFAQ